MTETVQNPPAKARWNIRSLLAARTEIAVFLLIVNLFAMGGLLWKIEPNKPPVIATVAVGQLSRMYGQQFAADPANTPEMIKLKTGLFMATTEKLIGQAAHEKGMVVFARECVLTGDAVDLTPEITASVDQALKAGGLAIGEGSHDALAAAR
jgi:hypothetical protein